MSPNQTDMPVDPGCVTDVFVAGKSWEGGVHGISGDLLVPSVQK